MTRMEDGAENATSGESQARIGAAISELLGGREFSLQARLDAVDVLSGSRPAARLLVRRGGEAEAMAARLLASRCHVEVSPTLVRQRRPAPGSLFVDCIELGTEPPAAECEDFVALYLSLTERAAATALKADFSGDDWGFGNSLGYPPCCVEFVCARGGVPAIHECYELYANDGLYNPLTWPAAAALDSALAPHYPCGRDCARSIAIAKLRLGVLARSGDPVDQARVQKALSSAYVFGADNSIECVADSESLSGKVARPMGDMSLAAGRSW